jgi:hypothetical protein
MDVYAALKSLRLYLVIILSCPLIAFANDVKIQGTFLHTVQASQQYVEPRTSVQALQIPLLKIYLSPKARAKLFSSLRGQSFSAYPVADKNELPEAVDLGMANVPVLNQGIHGSCVTFAAVAALDAILKKGDYVSSLCSLQLGRYLESYGYISSGWDGSFGASVLSQLSGFGFMSKEKQQQVGCGLLKEYPLLDKDRGEPMSTQEFHQFSESLTQNQIAWNHILDVYESLEDGVDKTKVLLQVKRALNHGDRLVFGTLLADYERGLAGAVGSYKAFNDTWVLSAEILENLQHHPQYAGHEMLIIGYDDAAIAKDDHGHVHQGLLKVRNSWGKRIGDQGDFYISYDYFNLLALEIQRVRSLIKEE